VHDATAPRRYGHALKSLPKENAFTVK
jgi:hypothetical protein